VTSYGGYVALMDIALNVVEKPKTINMAPNFIEPLQNLEIKVDKMTNFKYFSPSIFDIEQDSIDIKVDIKKVAGPGKLG
jgi:hypothetical protein